jgi:1,4-alpha-glucan branching enzyme
VFSDAKGYVADDGKGIDVSAPVVSLTKAADGVWEGDAPGKYGDFLSRPYMYRIKNAQGDTVYRTDIYSRSQFGKGHVDPAKASWDGTAATLDGGMSCSVVVDPDVVRSTFDSPRPPAKPQLIPAEEFWATEFTAGVPVPSRVEDLVIYEMHVNSLGFGKPGPGDLGDAMAMLDHVSTLGVNAIELLPMAEYSGDASWGYGDTHHLCIESSAGGRDKYRHFVRACHQRGIAVIQDVCYNHYDLTADRAEWQYDSVAPEQNIYYWYEGKSSDYPNAEGGYVDNGSSGWSPRFWEENVRKQFVSSGAFLLEEMHVDGMRVDLTQAFYRDSALHANGQPVASANIFGQRFLRQWCRTLHMIRPTAMLIAEDHTGWDKVTAAPDQGGLGFDATWRVYFYHDLIGDSKMAPSDAAKLLKNAGRGGDGPLGMDKFSGEVYDSQYNRVVFSESHDEAGNAECTGRTIVIAVNGAPLVGATRQRAEARSRVCFGLSVLSAGTPMFLMGEEIGAQKLFKVDYQEFLANREDILGDANGIGKWMFAFYRDIISLSRRLSSVRSHNIDILHESNGNRVIAFKRWNGDEQIIVVASLSNSAFSNGYVITKDVTGIPNAGWREVFNSDSAAYGGQNVGNGGAVIGSSNGSIQVVLPAAGFVVLQKG